MELQFLQSTFKIKLTAQILSHAWHSAASYSHPLCESLKARPLGVSTKSALSYFIWIHWSLISHLPRASASSYLLQWQSEAWSPVFSNIFLAPGSYFLNGIWSGNQIFEKIAIWRASLVAATSQHLKPPKSPSLWGAHDETMALQQAQV